MSTPILWKIPASVLATANQAFSLNIYQSTSGENGQYNLINSVPIAAGQAPSVSTYVDPGGNPSWYYYVTYTPAGGSEGFRVLAVQQPGVTEQRLAEQILSKLPEIILARVDPNLIDIRKAMQNALDIINAYTPVTCYGYTNLPGRVEAGIIVLGMTLLYMEHQLQVAIRDYSYGGTGINFNVDRNSKFSATLGELNKTVNSLLNFLKHSDWPVEPLGEGTIALATPQARIMGILYGTGST